MCSSLSSSSGSCARSSSTRPVAQQASRCAQALVSELGAGPARVLIRLHSGDSDTHRPISKAYATHTNREHSQSAGPTAAIHGRVSTIRQQLLPEARVYALSDGSRENARPDLFLKTAAAGTLAHEARMNEVFHMLGIGPEVLEYLPGSESQADWLLTRAVRGEDCTAERHLANPQRLCDTLATLLRQLHELPRTKHEQVAALAIPDVLADYLANAEHGMHTGRFDAQFCRLSQSDARRVIAEGLGHCIRTR